MWWEFDEIPFQKPGNYPKCIIFELGDSGSLKKIHKNSLLDQIGVNLVEI